MRVWRLIITVVGLLTALIWIGVFNLPDDNLHLVACDVGQGDGLLVIKRDVQIIIDGGPDSKILDCLAKYMPFWDRKIELVTLSHPQTDHYFGLIDVLERYNVEVFLASSLESSSQGYSALKNAVGGSQAKVVNPHTGQKIRLGSIYLEILHPDELENPVTNKLGTFISDRDPNEFSIIFTLKYGNFDALFTGDIGPGEIERIISRGLFQDVDYLKVPHHGSKNGLTEDLLKAVDPEIAVISVGKNQWGHPHQEVLQMLTEKNIKTYRTDINGTIDFLTDGKIYWLK